MTTVKDFYLNDIWQKVLVSISNSGQINSDVFDMCFTGSKLQDINEENASILVTSFINMTILNQYKEIIAAHLESVCCKRLEIKVVQESDLEDLNLALNSVVTEWNTKTLDSNYTFGNFVIGRSNAQAHLASLTCATNPGIIYNPLFIYGNSGLGKTHLLNAIGNKFLEITNNKKVCYMSGPDFVEAVVKSSKVNKLDEFKESFNNVDLLLLDDIQFIAGKDKTHEVFFSVFNNLVNNKKQVVITADKTPSDIKGLEERIISRFNQGLNVNIEAPEYETSVNILKMKIANNIGVNQSIDDDVISYIATNFSQDVRSLEGAINRLLFYSIEFSNKDHISLDLAIDAFKDQIKDDRGELNINIIRKTVCDYYNLTKQQIISSNRTKNIANARNIAIYLCRKLLDVSFDQIGLEFGKRDHSTIINSCERVEKLIKIEPAYLKAVNEIESKLK